ncbi:MAG: iron-sulfur cluster assembly accessory protein [Gammaproteobacteria bacterium]
MITVTPVAAKHMLESAKQGNVGQLPLRIAVQRQEDGSFSYGMGFDDRNLDNDIRFSCEGVEIVVSPASQELLKGTVVDYVELEPGQFHFVFMNPNDPNYRPASED